jgi:hypothetical protein
MTSPSQLIKEIREDSDKYSAICAELGALEKFRAVEVIQIYGEMTKPVMSTAERLWESREHGQKYLELKWIEKGLVRVISAKKTELRGLSEESHNQW